MRSASLRSLADAEVFNDSGTLAEATTATWNAFAPPGHAADEATTAASQPEYPKVGFRQSTDVHKPIWFFASYWASTNWLAADDATSASSAAYAVKLWAVSRSSAVIDFVTIHWLLWKIALQKRLTICDHLLILLTQVILE